MLTINPSLKPGLFVVSHDHRIGVMPPWLWLFGDLRSHKILTDEHVRLGIDRRSNGVVPLVRKFGAMMDLRIRIQTQSQKRRLGIFQKSLYVGKFSS